MARPSFGDEDGFRSYLGAIRRVPMLDRETELRLAHRFRKTGDPDASARIVEGHLRYVVKIATGYRGYGLSLADLVGEGNLGLLEAVRRFEPDRNLRFMTYASYWVRAYILAHVLKHWSIVGVGTGSRQARMFFRLQGERSRLGTRLGERDDSIDEQLAATFHTTQEHVRAMTERLAGRDASLDAQAFRDSSASAIDTLSDEAAANQEEKTADAEREASVRAHLARMWSTLDRREQLIVEERLMADDEATLAELGLRLGLSRERVRQLEERVKGKLRQALEPLARAA